MTTYEEELKETRSSITLLAAEYEANKEELCGSEGGVLSVIRQMPLPKRGEYLRLRNQQISEQLKKLQDKEKAVIESIAWDRRTQ